MPTRSQGDAKDVREQLALVAEVSLMATAADEPRQQRAAGRAGVKASPGCNEGGQRLEREGETLSAQRDGRVHMAQRTIDPDERGVPSSLAVGMVLDAHPDAACRSPAFDVRCDRSRETPEALIGGPGLRVL